jgi:hypothetical protein
MPGLINLYKGGEVVQLMPAWKVELGVQNIVLLAPDDQCWRPHLREKAFGHTPMEVAFTSSGYTHLLYV